MEERVVIPSLCEGSSGYMVELGSTIDSSIDVTIHSITIDWYRLV